MDHELKRRLIGATVLISLTIIFLPMILEHEPLIVDRGNMVPIPRAQDEKFNSSLIRDEVPEESSQPVAVDLSSEAQPVPDVKPVPVTLATAAAEVPEPEPVKTEPKPEPALESASKPSTSRSPRSKPGLSAWVIQVGSFSNKDNARKLVQRLRKAGLDTMDPQPATINGKKLYRVKVGPELDKHNAEKLLPRVKKVAGLQGRIIRYP